MYILSKLTNLVTGSVAETGEEGGELAADGGISVLFEDNLLEVGGRGDLEKSQLTTIAAHTFAIWLRTHPGLVAHQPLCCSVDLNTKAIRY